MKVLWCATGVLLLLLTSCSLLQPNEGAIPMTIKNLEDVVALFPTSVPEIRTRVERARRDAQTDLDHMLAIKKDERTFENTARAFDQALYKFQTQATAIGVLEHVSPAQELRDASRAAVLELSALAIDLFSNNVAVYQMFNDYVLQRVQNETLNGEQKYFLDELMKGFKRDGLHLPEPEREHIKRLQKDIAATSIEFSKNIADGQRQITVRRDDLAGLSEEFIATLHKTNDGLFILGTDYPTVTAVLEQCSVESTRKNLYIAFNQRAWPENMAVLDKLIAQRDELAQRLGYASYAHYDLDDQMVATPERAQTFIHDVAAKAIAKDRQEFELLTRAMPVGATLTADGKMKPWDRAYIIAQYKKNHFNLDEQALAEYFPMEKTIEGLIAIYEQFMSLQIKNHANVQLWHPDVRVLELWKDSVLRGYLILDLHPRSNKYSHAASQDVIATIINQQGQPTVAVNVVMANFPKSTATQPALLKHRDVETFFHEFGHAIHAILGSTHMASFSGTKTKTDFVEMPSQMLEEWLWNKDILKKISSHYKTGVPLPDALIDAKIALKNISSGGDVMRQLSFAQLSLEYFKKGAHKDTAALEHKVHNEFRPYLAYEPQSHHQASFGHLTEYGAKYYGYMWSKVFALDLFDTIRQHGLLDKAIGKKYVDEILGKGGSVDPNILLQQFLGREPRQDAFLKELGLQ